MKTEYTIEQLRNGNYDHEKIEKIQLSNTEDWREIVDCATIAIDEEYNVIYQIRCIII